MPRRSSESFTVIPAPLTRVYPAPPSSLTARQQEIFRDVVHSREPGFFDPTNLLMLASLCRHAATIERISVEIDHELASELPSDDRLAKLTRMRSVESSALASFSTKLRLSNQSRLSEASGRSSFERGARLTLPKPWESVEADRARRNKEGTT